MNWWLVAFRRGGIFGGAVQCEVRLRNLGVCLAQAGALCAAFNLGDHFGSNWTAAPIDRQWSPNVKGRPAPGWRQ